MRPALAGAAAALTFLWWAPIADALPSGGACAPPDTPGEQVIAWATTNTDGPGWLAADTSGGVPLDHSTVWFFGDTVVGSLAPDGSPTGTSFVSSSAIVVDGSCAHPVPAGGGPFFDPDLGDRLIYWPNGATTVGDRVFVVFTELETPARGQLAGAFHRNLLLELNADDLSIRAVHDMPSDTSHQLGTVLVAIAGRVYAYGTSSDSGSWPRRTVVARFDPQVPDTSWECWTAVGWSPCTSLTALVPLGGLPATTTTTWQWRWRGGVATAVGDSVFGRVTIDIYWSPGPAGPFTRAGFLTEIPQPTDVPQGFVYVAGAVPLDADHVQLAWNVNTFDRTVLEQRIDFYHPHFVTVTMPPVGRRDGPNRVFRFAAQIV